MNGKLKRSEERSMWCSSPDEKYATALHLLVNYQRENFQERTMSLKVARNK